MTCACEGCKSYLQFSVTEKTFLPQQNNPKLSQQPQKCCNIYAAYVSCVKKLGVNGIQGQEGAGDGLSRGQMGRERVVGPGPMLDLSQHRMTPGYSILLGSAPPRHVAQI